MKRDGWRDTHHDWAVAVHRRSRDQHALWVFQDAHLAGAGLSVAEGTPPNGAERVHDLKCWPAYFKDLMLGIKPFEVRKDDRDFKVGDTLRLEEFNPTTESYTGRSIHRRVTYVLPGGQFGIEDGYVVMGIS